jgi:hypothetical protein
MVLHGSGGARTPPVPVTELLGSLLGLFRVGGHWRGGGSALLVAPVLGELPVFDQQIKTGAASVGLLVRPFVHAKLAIDEYFLALLNEVPEILGGLTPYLEVHKSRDLFFFPLSVGVMLVVGDRGRDHRLTTGSVSAFGIFGEVSGDVDCVDVHRGDLGFWLFLDRLSTLYYATCRIQKQSEIANIFVVSASLREGCCHVYNIISDG